MLCGGFWFFFFFGSDRNLTKLALTRILIKPAIKMGKRQDREIICEAVMDISVLVQKYSTSLRDCFE